MSDYGLNERLRFVKDYSKLGQAEQHLVDVIDLMVYVNGDVDHEMLVEYGEEQGEVYYYAALGVAQFLDAHFPDLGAGLMLHKYMERLHMEEEA
jgi:hypothetical protein